MTPGEERWAEAIAVRRRHGEGAPVFIAERIGALAMVGDRDGVERWREIAARVDELRSGAISHPQ